MSIDHEHDYTAIGRSDCHPPRQDYHRGCRQQGCPGIARVQIAWAPDTGWHWLKCCCCGDYWNPGPERRTCDPAPIQPDPQPTPGNPTIEVDEFWFRWAMERL